MNQQSVEVAHPAGSGGAGRAAVSDGDGASSGRPRREPLSRERIIRAALRVMDEEGLEAVTMRRIGRELGVEAMSLYNHVVDKENLLSGVVEAAMGEFEFPEDTGDWDETTRRTARAWRRLLKAHPNVITLMSERRKPMTSLQAIRPIEHALHILGQAGLGPEETARAFRAFGGYIQGFVLAEVANMFGSEEVTVRPEDIAAALPLDELPHLVAHLPYVFDCHDLDADFEYGLDLMIQGMKAKVSAGAGRTVPRRR